MNNSYYFKRGRISNTKKTDKILSNPMKLYFSWKKYEKFKRKNSELFK